MSWVQYSKLRKVAQPATWVYIENMDLQDYVDSFGRPALIPLAKKAGTTQMYLDQCRGNGLGKRSPSPKLVKRLVVASEGLLTPERLRPDIYGLEAA